MGNTLSAVGSIIPGIAATKEAFGGKQVGQTKELGNVTNALYNPQNSLYKQLYGQNRQNNLTSLSEAITELERRNRSLSGMGRTPLFNPERRGEMAFRELSRGYQGLDQQARNQSLDQLRMGADVLSGRTIPATRQMTNDRLGGYSNIGDFLMAIGR